MKVMKPEPVDKMKELRNTLGIPDVEVPSVEEVMQAVQVLMAVINEVRTEGFEEHERTRTSLTRVMADRISSAEARLKLQISALLKFKKQMEKEKADSTAIADLEYALGRLEDQENQISNLRTEISQVAKLAKRKPKDGFVPAHEWEGSRLRWQNKDGSWGKWVDLRGMPGMPGEAMGGILGVPALFAASSNVHIRRGDNGLYISVDESGGGGANIATETVTATDAGGNNVNIDLTQLDNFATLVAVTQVFRNGALQDTSKWSIVGSTLTLTGAVSTNSFQITYTYA